MSAIRDGRLNSQSTVPLFHSAADFLPEDPEHEQERLDLYSLERSRRHFGAYASSSAAGGEEEYEDDEEDEEDDEDSTQELRRSRGRGRFLGSGGGNIKSSWRADRSGTAKGGSSVFSNGTERGSGSRGKDKMVDVRLDDHSEHEHSETDDFEHAGRPPFFGYEKPQRSSYTDDDDDDGAQNPPDDITIQMPRDESPLPFQKLNRPPREPSSGLAFAPPQEEDYDDARDQTPFIPRETERSKGPQTMV